jgi:hypothetical protein
MIDKMASVNPYSIDSIKKRWNEFMLMDGKKSFMYTVDYNAEIPARPHLWPEKKRERLDWVLRKYDVLHEQAQWLHDDMIPHLDLITGTEIFAEAFGCKVYRPENDMPSARPLVHNSLEASRIKIPDLEGSTLTLLFEIADEARTVAGHDTVVKLPDIQSPMDIAALIWDKTDFFVAMLEEPDAVQELEHKVSNLLMAFLDQWFTRYGKSFIAHFPFYYMSSGITLSEDEAGSVSPQVFREFFLPELSSLSERYGGLGMHCCANSRHQWDNFKEIPGLRLLNIAQPGNIVNEAVEFFAGHVAQNHIETFTKNEYFGGQPAWEWPKIVPDGVHMVLNASAETRSEAEEICDRLSRACGRS